MGTISKAVVTMLTAVILAVAPDHVRHIEGAPYAITDTTHLASYSERNEGLNMRPTPALSPGEVVQIIVEALGLNDVPYADAGAEVAFRFSSPENQNTTGPLDNFVELVHNPIYSPVLNHLHARYGNIEIVENEATVPVVVVSQDGQRHGYLFTLKRQIGGEFNGCWMTDSVLPFEVEYEEESPLVLKASLTF